MLWIFVPDGRRHVVRRRKPDGTLETLAEARKREYRMDLLRKSAQKSATGGSRGEELQGIGLDVNVLEDQIREALGNRDPND